MARRLANHSTTPCMPRSAASARWRSAPLRAASVRACSSSAAPPRRSAAGRDGVDQRNDPCTRGLRARRCRGRAASRRARGASRASGSRRCGCGRGRAAPRRRRGARRATPPAPRRTRSRRPRPPPWSGCRARAARSCRTSSWGRSSYQGSPASGKTPPRRPQRSNSARSSHEPQAGGTPWRGSRSQSFGPQRGEAGVAPGVQRRVAGQRGELGEVGAQRVVDRERAVGAADGDVHVQPEHELARRAPRGTPRSGARTSGRRSARPRGRRTGACRRSPAAPSPRRRRRARGARPPARRRPRRSWRTPARRSRPARRAARCAARRRRRARRARARRRQQVERLGVEQHQLLLDADRVIGHAVEQRPPAVRVEPLLHGPDATREPMAGCRA